MWGVTCLIYVVWLSLPSPVAARSGCLSLYKRGDYLSAAACFQQQAKQMGPGASLSLTQKWNKGRLLKNAARSYMRVANASATRQKLAQAAFRREQALKLLALYIKEKLYESRRRRREVERMQRQLEAKIQYATLLVETGLPSARICVKGFRYDRCLRQGRWRLRLRPGTYQVRISARGRPLQTRQHQARPGQSHTLRFALQSVGVLIETQPKGANVRIQGTYQGQTPLRLSLNPGTYTIRFSYRCYHSVVQELKLRAGQRAVSLRRKLQPTSTPDPHQTQRIVGWSVLIGGAVVLLGAGITQGLQVGHSQEYKNYQRQYEALPAGAATFAQLHQQALAAYDAALTTQWVAGVGFGVGGVAATIGLISLLSLPPSTSCR